MVKRHCRNCVKQYYILSVLIVIGFVGLVFVAM